jgi:hypothetical protein
MNLRGPDSTQQRFAQLAWLFNCHIAAMAHASWLRSPQQAADRAWSAHLLARRGVDRTHDWTLAGVASRLWLIDGPSLQLLLQAVYGLTQRPQWVRAVSKARRDALRAQWSEPAWEAASDASAPKVGVVSATAVEEAADAPRIAARVLLGLLPPTRPAVVQRARLRLPQAWRDDEACTLAPDAAHDLGDWIARRWIPQRSAAWAWLF